ncbi:MAG: 16S rRNA (adenine(1518)-N(6)/adenine(1519)-N(6))-dimethyltransferase RsmA [Bacilli bacterium]|nr:16S rRNA (adenine(1518)-N(6)/adenine(1519)-N(6))-dimethyltransferase RsmA [Bacilli bacterium]
MEKYDVKFKKKFGQNFLKDVNIVKHIVSCANITGKSLVIEVGPGGAIMTRELANVADQVVAYEIDTDLKDELYSRLVGLNNVDVNFCDFLEADLLKDLDKYDYDNLYFVSNVPYYITTPILMKLINSKLNFNKIVMMVQKEVGDRFSTSPGNREYGSITVLLNYYFKVKKEFNVSRNNFVPVPNVDSVIVSFTNREDRLQLNDFDKFQKLVLDSFQFKRKNLKNNLKNYDLNVISDVLSKYNYDLNVRAEQLSVEVFVDIANSI